MIERAPDPNPPRRTSSRAAAARSREKVKEWIGALTPRRNIQRTEERRTPSTPGPPRRSQRIEERRKTPTPSTPGPPHQSQRIEERRTTPAPSTPNPPRRSRRRDRSPPADPPGRPRTRRRDHAPSPKPQAQVRRPVTRAESPHDGAIPSTSGTALPREDHKKRSTRDKPAQIQPRRRPGKHRPPPSARAQRLMMRRRAIQARQVALQRARQAAERQRKRGRPRGIPPPSSGYRCPICQKRFVNRRWLMLHQRNVHFAGGPLQEFPWIPDNPPWDAIPDPDGKPEEPMLKVEYLLNRSEILRRNDHNPEGPIGVYNFPTNDLPGGAEDLVRFLEEVNQMQERTYKCTISISLMLYNTTTDRYRFFAGYEPLVEGLISKPADLGRITRRLRRIDVDETIRRARPNTNWRYRMITNVTVRAYRYNFALGRTKEGDVLPEWLLKRRKTIAPMVGYKRGKPYKDRLCFFRCLAFHRRKTMYMITPQAYQLYQEWRRYAKAEKEETLPRNPTTYRGILPSDIADLEVCFKININLYSATDAPPAVVVQIYLSLGRYEDEATMNLNLHGLHLSYIKDWGSYAKKYACDRCFHHFTSKYKLRQHLSKNCSRVTKEVHPGGLFKRKQSFFEELEDFNIHVDEEDRHYLFHIIFDFEAMLREVPPGDQGESVKLKWLQRHEIISAGLVSNVPGHEEPLCIIEPDPAKLVSEMIDYIHSVQKTAESIMTKKMQYVLDAIEEEYEWWEELENEIGGEAAEEEDDGAIGEKIGIKVREAAGDINAGLSELRDKIKDFCRVIQVVGFHSGRYDMNLIKGQLTTELIRREETVRALKKNQSYLSLSTERMRFVDISAYISPPKSLRSFLRAFDIEEEKFFFPFSLLTNPENLKLEGVPSYDSFFSDLKGYNSLEEEEIAWKEAGSPEGKPYTSGKENYAMVCRTWKENNFKTLEDLLRFYNLRDVCPLSKAVESMRVMYKEIGVAIFSKSVISIPGVSRFLLYQTAEKKNVQFSLFSRQDRDAYMKIRKAVTGGPSLIFRRVTKAFVTYIKENPDKLCKNVTCEDANALYLYCLGLEMPTGMYVRRQKEDDFKPRLQYRFMKQFRWMDAEAEKRKIKILHAMNNTAEKRIGTYLCDGFHAETRTIFEYNGCYHHMHYLSGECKMNTGRKKKRVEEKDAYEATLFRAKVLERLGYTVVSCWECQHEERLQELDLSEEKMNEINSRYLPPFFREKKYERPSKKDLLRAVKEDKLFGFLEVDIHVPTSLYEKFCYFPPLYVTTEVGIENIGTLMKKHAEKEGELKVRLQKKKKNNIVSVIIP